MPEGRAAWSSSLARMGSAPLGERAKAAKARSLPPEGTLGGRDPFGPPAAIEEVAVPEDQAPEDQAPEEISADGLRELADDELDVSGGSSFVITAPEVLSGTELFPPG